MPSWSTSSHNNNKQHTSTTLVCRQHTASWIPCRFSSWQEYPFPCPSQDLSGAYPNQFGNMSACACCGTHGINTQTSNKYWPATSFCENSARQADPLRMWYLIICVITTTSFQLMTTNDTMGRIASICENHVHTSYKRTIKIATAQSLPRFVLQSDLEFLGKTHHKAISSHMTFIQ